MFSDEPMFPKDLIFQFPKICSVRLTWAETYFCWSGVFNVVYCSELCYVYRPSVGLSL